MSRASLPHSSHRNTGKLIEPYIAKLGRRVFSNESDERFQLLPISFSLFPHLYKDIFRHPRDRGFDPAGLIVFVRAAGSDKHFHSSGGSGARLEFAIWSIPCLRRESAVYYKSLPWEASRSSFEQESFCPKYSPHLLVIRRPCRSGGIAAMFSLVLSDSKAETAFGEVSNLTQAQRVAALRQPFSCP
jgi:hypothetical protein